MFDVIPSGVPLPRVDRSPRKGRRKYPLDTTPVGGMFFLPGRKCKSVSAYISRITRTRPERFSARHVFMRPGTPEEATPWVLCDATDPQAQEGTGVWRVE